MEPRDITNTKPLSSRRDLAKRVRQIWLNRLLASGFFVTTSLHGGFALPGYSAWTTMLPAQAQEAERTLRIPSAIQFPIVFKKVIDSSKAMVGDEVIATLKEDIVIDDELIAPEGSIVIGHISKLKQSRRLTESVISKNRRFHKGSSMKIELDEIITDEDEHIPIVGCLSKQTADFFDGKQPREVEITAGGELIKAEAVFTNDQKVASQIVNFAASTGVGQLGTAASFGALPVVMGVIGAVEPAMVMSRPMKPDEKHPRVKGFAWGVWTTVPGAPVIQAVAFKGSDLRIEPGDEFLAQAHSPYEPVLSITSKILRRNSSSVSGTRVNSNAAKTPGSAETKLAPAAAAPTATVPGTPPDAKPAAVAAVKVPMALVAKPATVTAARVPAGQDVKPAANAAAKAPLSQDVKPAAVAAAKVVGTPDVKSTAVTAVKAPVSPDAKPTSVAAVKAPDRLESKPSAVAATKPVSASPTQVSASTKSPSL